MRFQSDFPWKQYSIPKRQAYSIVSLRQMEFPVTAANATIFSPPCIWIKQFAHVWASSDDAVILFVRKHDGNSKNLSRRGLHIKFALQYWDRR